MLDPFSPFVFLLIVMCSFRLTRFFVYDSLVGGHLESGSHWSRWVDRKAFTAQGADKSWFWSKVATLCSCVFCAGFWCSLGTLSLFLWLPPWQFTPQEWALLGAICGGQVMLSRASRKWLET